VTDPNYEELIRKYALLEVKMKELYGNGKPGRVDELEAAVSNHNRYLWMAIGALTVLTPLVAMLVKQYMEHLWR